MKKVKIKEDAGEIAVQGTAILPSNPDLPVNENIPTFFADIVNSMYNSTAMIGQLSFFARAQGKNVEQCRVAVPSSTLQEFVDIVCLHLNYYPKPPKK